MSHHGREDEVEECGAWCADNARKLCAAHKALETIASIDPDEDYRNTRCATVRRIADAWLVESGYPGVDELRERAKRERRAAELDAEIACLQAERVKL